MKVGGTGGIRGEGLPRWVFFSGNIRLGEFRERWISFLFFLSYVFALGSYLPPRWTCRLRTSRLPLCGDGITDGGATEGMEGRGGR